MTTSEDDVTRWQEAPASIRAAVQRALARQQRDALGDVEQILDAALRVAERVSPAEPKVADIVAEAGTSNQAFYRYFPGKPDLLLALLERGLVRLCSYLRHRMAKESDPSAQVLAWVDGMVLQLVHDEAARQGTAFMRQSVVSGRMRDPAGIAVLDQLAALLVDPLTALGRPHPLRDAQLVQDTVTGVLQRHIAHGTAPDVAECRHLAEFCLVAVGAAVPAHG